MFVLIDVHVMFTAQALEENFIINCAINSLIQIVIFISVLLSNMKKQAKTEQKIGTLDDI